MSEGLAVTNPPVPPYGGDPYDPMTRRSDPGDFTTQRSDALAWEHEGPAPAEQPQQYYGADPYQHPYQQQDGQQPSISNTLNRRPRPRLARCPWER